MSEELLVHYGEVCTEYENLKKHITEQDLRIEYYAGFYDAMHLVFDEGGKE